MHSLKSIKLFVAGVSLLGSSLLGPSFEARADGRLEGRREVVAERAANERARVEQAKRLRALGLEILRRIERQDQAGQVNAIRQVAKVNPPKVSAPAAKPRSGVDREAYRLARIDWR